MPSITWIDSTGAGTLSNSKPAPGNRLANWTPRATPIGPGVNALGTGALHRFRFRTDYLALFEIPAIPAADMELMLRLQLHLLNGGVVQVVDSLSEHITSSRFAYSTLAPDTEPEISFSDRTLLEYTFSVTLKSEVSVSAGDLSALTALQGEMELWLKADSLLLTLANGDKVTNWVDDSGSFRHANQAVVNEQPVFKTNILNGLPVVDFAGSVQGVYGHNMVTGNLLAATARTVYLVAKRTGAYDAVDRFITWGDSGGGGALIFDNAGAWAFYPTEAVAVQALGGSVTDFTIVTINIASESSAQGYLAGVAAGASFDPHPFALHATLSRPMVVGAETDGGDRAIAGQFAEIMSYRVSHTAPQMATVHSYLGTKWARPFA